MSERLSMRIINPEIAFLSHKFAKAFVDSGIPAINIQNELVFESLISNEDQKIFCLDKQNDNYVNNTITFKYAMINIKASNQTYKNFDTFFNNLLKEINSNKKE